MKALCKESNIPLYLVESREKLGELVGLRKVDKTTQEAKKTVKTSVAVVADLWGDGTEEAVRVLKEYIAKSDE